MVSGCLTCLTYRNCQQSESKVEHEIPDTPWDKVATDLFTIYDKDYVIAVDYFSKLFEVAQACEFSCSGKSLEKDFCSPWYPKDSVFRWRSLICCHRIYQVC